MCNIAARLYSISLSWFFSFENKKKNETYANKNAPFGSSSRMIGSKVGIFVHIGLFQFF